MKMKENSKIVYEFVKAHEAEDITAKDIADATGLSSRQVNGIITMAFQRHKDEDKNEVPLMERVPGEPTTDEKGKAVIPKYIHLTDEGRAITVEDAE
jgi:hypothetical protein